MSIAVLSQSIAATNIVDIHSSLGVNNPDFRMHSLWLGSNRPLPNWVPLWCTLLPSHCVFVTIWKAPMAWPLILFWKVLETLGSRTYLEEVEVSHPCPFLSIMKWRSPSAHPPSALMFCPNTQAKQPWAGPSGIGVLDTALGKTTKTLSFTDPDHWILVVLLSQRKYWATDLCPAWPVPSHICSRRGEFNSQAVFQRDSQGLTWLPCVSAPLILNDLGGEGDKRNGREVTRR